MSKEMEWINNYVRGLESKSDLTPELEASIQQQFGYKPGEEPEEDVVYRGLFFKSEEDLQTFLRQISDEGFVEMERASWTFDVWVSFDFFGGKGFEHYYQELPEDSYQLIVSTCVKPEQIIFSYEKVLEAMKEQGITNQALTNLKNEEECFLRSDSYRIEIDKASVNAQRSIECILGEGHPSIPWIEFID